MAANFSISIFCLVSMLLLLAESHAEIDVATIETPAPAPVIQPSKNLTTFLDSLLVLNSCSDFVSVFLSFSMAPPKAVFNHKIALHVARTDARTHNTRSRACSSAKSAVPNACVCHLEPTATSRSALATTTGKPKGEDPNAPEC
ncbi:hypothetical protein Fmac_025087 [Flemingia macrophylla]|uniref:Uncharacterized protein n=1 Tax=Flemingia macrophylla TaxID=520843 RepID=A0ABD1LR97_9FABA